MNTSAIKPPRPSSPFLASPLVDQCDNVFSSSPEDIGSKVERGKAPRPARTFSPVKNSRSIDSFALYQYGVKGSKIASSSPFLVDLAEQ